MASSPDILTILLEYTLLKYGNNINCYLSLLKNPKKSSEFIILRYILKLVVVIGKVLLYINLFLI